MILSLTNGMQAQIDPDDSILARRYRWSWASDLSNRKGDGQIVSYQGQGKLVLARIILNAERGERVGMRDGNPLNCRRSNLYLIDEEEEKHRQRIADLRHTGLSFRQIGQAVGISGTQAHRLYKTYIEKVLMTDPFEHRVPREFESTPLYEGNLRRYESDEGLAFVRRRLSTRAKELFDSLLLTGQADTAKRQMGLSKLHFVQLRDEIAAACIKAGF